MKERSPSSVNFVDLQLLKDQILDDTFRQNMKEKSPSSVNFVHMHLLQNNNRNYTFRECMKEKNHWSVNFVYMQQFNQTTLTNIFRQTTGVWSNTFIKNLNVNFAHTPLPKSIILINTFYQFIKKRNHVNTCFMNMLHLTVHEWNCSWGKEYKSLQHELNHITPPDTAHPCKTLFSPRIQLVWEYTLPYSPPYTACLRICTTLSWPV